MNIKSSWNKKGNPCVKKISMRLKKRTPRSMPGAITTEMKKSSSKDCDLRRAKTV